MVRVDDAHYHKGWNWERGHFLSMDKGTVRGMIGAQVFNVALPTRSGRQIAEFSPAGLNQDRVKQACDLTPKKPSRDKLDAAISFAMGDGRRRLDASTIIRN